MLTAPKLDYALLAPILVILGAALIGVLVEAFIKQAWRARMQLVIALGAIVVSFNLLVRVRNQGSSIAAVTSVSIDGAGMFLQGAILINIGADLIACEQLDQTYSGSGMRRYLAGLSAQNSCRHH